MAVVIKSKIERFRRAGVAHSKAPTTYPDDHFTEAQMEQLRNEPNLIVEEGVADEPAKKAPAKKAPAKKAPAKKADA